MPVCKLTNNRNDCVLDPNLYWDDLDDDSKRMCYQNHNNCRLKDEYLQGGPQPMNLEGGRRHRRGHKSRKGRKGRKGRRTQRSRA